MPKYEYPDHNISLVWSERGGGAIHWSASNQRWLVAQGQGERLVCRGSPKRGDWLPWTPPVFPERVKVARRCYATVDGSRRLLLWYPTGGITPFRESPGTWHRDSEVTDIYWLDPEYLDELPPDPRKESA